MKMKSFWIRGILLGLYGCSFDIYASAVYSIPNHLVINRRAEIIWYSLNAPERVYSGYVYPNESKRVLIYDNMSNGTYYFQYKICDEWLFKCRSEANRTLNIKKPEEVMWEVTPKEIKVTETEL